MPIHRHCVIGIFLFNDSGRILFVMSTSSWTLLIAAMCLAILLAKTSHQRETPYRLRMLSAYGTFLRLHNVRAFFNACALRLSAVFPWNHSSMRALPLNETQTHTFKGTENTKILLNKLTFSLTKILCISISYILRTRKMTATNNTTKPSMLDAYILDDKEGWEISMELSKERRKKLMPTNSKKVEKILATNTQMQQQFEHAFG